MRLKQIKLAGFKSFVDPTTVPFPGALTAIVGPNGCGKSNVIDAVRWVMGESSAKNLRGDSMTDVIFNGSTARKPVGQASVELVFDNSDGGLGGEYANYNEISLKRLVTRDAQSHYFLNGTRCRRKDITDIFLGTGLGPRSYAIIEQGMISRFIESKPQELRIFIEEAAGISKYKERRRETENRIQHTRENLDRLGDLREELGKQLAHLQRQAQAAAKYKELKAEERELKAQLTALRWGTVDGKIQDLEQQIGRLETEFEAQVAEQRRVEAESEQAREQHLDYSDQFNAVQGRFYGIGAEIARLEQTIKHTRERKRQLADDFAQAEGNRRQALEHLESDQARIEELSLELAEAEPEYELAQASGSESGHHLTDAEQSMAAWQGEWDQFNQLSSQNTRRAEVERTRIQHAETLLARQDERIRRLADEQAGLAANPEAEAIEELLEQLAEAELAVETAQGSMAEVAERIDGARGAGNQLSQRIDSLRGEVQKLAGRRASLEALQQAALGKQSGALLHWLKGQNLHELPRLAQGLSVAEGWGRAVEVVLGQHLEAVCLEGMDSVAALLDSLPKASFAAFDLKAQATATTGSLATPLSDKVQADFSLSGLLAGVYAVEGLDQALALRPRLAAHESVVTRDGIWLGAQWLRVVRDQDAKTGLLEREAELKQIHAELAEKEATLAELEAQREAARAELRGLEQQREQLQRDNQGRNRRFADLKAQVSAKQTRIEQMKARVERLNGELAEAREQVREEQETLAEARATLEELLEHMAGDVEQRELLSRRRDELRANLDHIRARARDEREVSHKLALRIESLRTGLTSAKASFERMQAQIRGVDERMETLKAQLEEGEGPLIELQEELEAALKKRIEVETELSAARERLDQVEQALRSHDKLRLSAEQNAQAVRSRLESVRLECQGQQVRRTTLLEQLAEGEHQLDAVRVGLPEGANEKEWEERIAKLDASVGRLGAINLAAIEEYDSQSERKTYLDAQNEDLVKALDTLEDAIRKIDKETRTKFRETFDLVNKGLQDLFPKVFGGGHAYLELTEEDLLETGVTIMARPPGKRNSTIHLLSGGEKALTAVAMVFSIFQLNPAPFCMLDEVDAPLDDANVGRFCRLVKEMSEKVQFIYITHNKVAMEMATHLSGVTMQEPGVSRLVAVDVEEAAALANA
ncbi:MAG: chromosome segregation protein SMC [Gammaproteobacteria bacterium]|nr:chromosome segregation protein SMC [Gammaproteobacteria bacterium]